MAKVEISGELVIFRDGRCHCRIPAIRSVLQDLIDEIPSWQPEQDNQAAQKAVEQFGGRILELDQPQAPLAGDWMH